MISFPNAKVNLGLRILRKLPSGFHEIKSLMVPTGFKDILEVVPSKNDSLRLSGIEIPGKQENNLLFKVLAEARKNYTIPPVYIHLHKAIPPGAGLGGGSADASFFLNLLNDLFELNIPLEKREKIMAAIGSDCPFFIKNKPSIVTGTGTDLEEFPIDISGLYLIIAVPEFSISTPEAYSGVSPAPEEVPLEKLLHQPVDRWKESVVNDFEKSLFPKFPKLEEIKHGFYEAGALYSCLSGSGSAVIGLFQTAPCNLERLENRVVFRGKF